MKTEMIKAVFTNLLFVVGVLLIIFGFSQATLTGVRLAIFDQYPLNAYEESRCEMGVVPAPVMRGEESEEVSEQEQARRKEQCLQSLEHQRKIKLTEDIVTATTTLISGGVLVYFFRKFIFGQ